MFLWIIAGYVLSAVAFYSYIVTTAQEEPLQNVATLVEISEWKRTAEQQTRKAA